MRSRVAVVVGAGIGGLAAAIALRRSGWNVRVFERAASPRELGFALLLAPNAMHALGGIGLAETARRGGAVATSGEMRRPDGTVLRRFDTAGARELLDEDTVCILRPILHSALLDAAGRDLIELSAHASAFRSAADRVELTLTDGRVMAADVIVGADGVGSTIRTLLHPTEPAPRPSGLLAVRGVAHDAAEHLGTTSGAQYFGCGFEAGVARASERHVYWYLSVRADQFPAPHDALSVATQCARQFHAPFRAVVTATAKEDLRLDELFVLDPISDWGRGPVTLLGDAAHPMLPHAGQGAAQALEDAIALGTVLREASTVPQVAAALRHYERVRARRTRAVMTIAQRNARLGSISNPVACWLRDQAIRMMPQTFILRSLVAFGKPPEITSIPTP
jgi:2-polyprenyl-6-methoxyphenol hydroxylase-like FAD-dependent oxidoreductase